MSIDRDTAHERFADRIADHLLDLLDAEESAQLEAHARTCESCGRRLAAARAAKPDWWDGTGHPPVDALEVHAARPASLDAFARAALERHLADCTECREDALALSGAPEAAPVEPAVDRRVLPAYAPWALAGSMAAALLAFVYLRPQRAAEPVAAIPPEVRQPSPSDSPTAPSAPAAAPAKPAAPSPPAATTMPPVTIGGATRGAAGEATHVDLPAGLTEVAFTLPALFVPEGAIVVIELRDDADVVLSRDELPAARALAPGGVRLSAARLAKGARVLRVAWFDDAAGSESREYPLIVTRR